MTVSNHSNASRSTSMFTPTYLYVKQHRITKLKYFGKTTKDPYSYLGSGTKWTRHISKHGKEHVETIWVKLFCNREELTLFAQKFSEENDIVESSTWANLCPENGIDGGFRTNSGKNFQVLNSKPRSETHKLAISQSRKNKRTVSKRCSFNGVIYESIIDLANERGVTHQTIRNWIKKNKVLLIPKLGNSI